MKIGRVVGTVVSTIEAPVFHNSRLLLCDLLGLDGKPAGGYTIAVDTVGAGDTFTAALTVALVEGQAPQAALQFACAAGAAAATRAGAQPSLPTREEVEWLLRR